MLNTKNFVAPSRIKKPITAVDRCVHMCLMPACPIALNVHIAIVRKPSMLMIVVKLSQKSGLILCIARFKRFKKMIVTSPL